MANFKRFLLRLIIIVWIINWLFFLEVALLLKGGLKLYAEIIGKPVQEIRKLVYGPALVELLDYGKEVIPEGSTYKLAGIGEDELEYVQSIYYLYPLLKSPHPPGSLSNRLDRSRPSNGSNCPPQSGKRVPPAPSNRIDPPVPIGCNRIPQPSASIRGLSTPPASRKDPSSAPTQERLIY